MTLKLARSIRCEVSTDSPLRG